MIYDGHGVTLSYCNC